MSFSLRKINIRKSPPHLWTEKMKPKPQNFLEFFEKHLRDTSLPSRLRAGASENTIRGYIHDLHDFLTWFEQTERNPLTIALLQRDPFKLNKRLVQSYINSLEGRVGAATVLRKVSSLRAFTKYLQEKEFIAHEPMNGLLLPEKAEPEPRGLSDSDRSRLESAFQQPWLPSRTPKRKRKDDVEKNVLEDAKQRLVRDRAIAFLMLYAGPRVDETCNINVGDVVLKQKSGWLHIRKGKGLRERRTAIHVLLVRSYRNGWICVRNWGLRMTREEPCSSAYAERQASDCRYAPCRIWYPKPRDVQASRSPSLPHMSFAIPVLLCFALRVSTSRREQRCSVIPLRPRPNMVRLAATRSRKLPPCWITLKRRRLQANSITAVRNSKRSSALQTCWMTR